MKIDNQGYVYRSIPARINTAGRPPKISKELRGRDWWLIKHPGLLTVLLPVSWIGKKVKIKIEELTEDKQ